MFFRLLLVDSLSSGRRTRSPRTAPVSEPPKLPRLEASRPWATTRANRKACWPSVPVLGSPISPTLNSSISGYLGTFAVHPSPRRPPLLSLPSCKLGPELPHCRPPTTPRPSCPTSHRLLLQLRYSIDSIAFPEARLPEYCLLAELLPTTYLTRQSESKAAREGHTCLYFLLSANVAGSPKPRLLCVLFTPVRTPSYGYLYKGPSSPNTATRRLRVTKKATRLLTAFQSRLDISRQGLRNCHIRHCALASLKDLGRGSRGPFGNKSSSCPDCKLQASKVPLPDRRRLLV